MKQITQAFTFSRIEYKGINEVLVFEPGRLAASLLFFGLGFGASLLQSKIAPDLIKLPFKKEINDELSYPEIDNPNFS